MFSHCGVATVHAHDLEQDALEQAITTSTLAWDAAPAKLNSASRWPHSPHLQQLPGVDTQETGQEPPLSSTVNDGDRDSDHYQAIHTQKRQCAAVVRRAGNSSGVAECMPIQPPPCIHTRAHAQTAPRFSFGGTSMLREFV